MKIQIQVSLTGVQYSRNQIELEDPTDEDIINALKMLDKVDNIFQAMRDGTLTDTTAPATQDTLATDMLAIENKQLKDNQVASQEFMNLMEHKYPDAYKEISSLVQTKIGAQ